MSMQFTGHYWTCSNCSHRTMLCCYGLGCPTCKLFVEQHWAACMDERAADTPYLIVEDTRGKVVDRPRNP